jgi:hypothetical protein
MEIELPGDPKMKVPSPEQFSGEVQETKGLRGGVLDSTLSPPR